MRPVRPLEHCYVALAVIAAAALVAVYAVRLFQAYAESSP